MARHDQSPEAMACGLYEVSWDFSACLLGHMEWTGGQEETNVIDSFRRLLKVTNKGCRAGRYILREVIQENGWKTIHPLDSGAVSTPIQSRFVGLSGDGACPKCKDKKPKKLKYRDVRAALLGMWESYVWGQRYRRYQCDVLETTNFFNDDDSAYAIHTAYERYQASLMEAMECMCGVLGQYKALVKEPCEGAALYRLAAKARSMPEVTDLTYDRNWCKNCKAKLVPIPNPPL